MVINRAAITMYRVVNRFFIPNFKEISYPVKPITISVFGEANLITQFEAEVFALAT
jgi:hypothetical protein